MGFDLGMEEKYEPLKELGSGNFGVARLVRDKKTKDLFAVKYIERGKKVIFSLTNWFELELINLLKWVCWYVSDLSFYFFQFGSCGM